MRNEREINRNATTAMAMAILGHDPTKPYGYNNKVSKGESKKCKSCRHFEECKRYKNVSPMQIACNQHERRKKK